MREEYVILGVIILYVIFVVGGNYWAFRDTKKMMDDLYGRKK